MPYKTSLFVTILKTQYIQAVNSKNTPRPGIEPGSPERPGFPVLCNTIMRPGHVELREKVYL